MAAQAVLRNAGGLAYFFVERLYGLTIGACLASSRRVPTSPTLSAQEGELDNLLAEPTGGWDDDTISIAPRSTRYGKEGLVATRQRSASSATKGTTASGDHDATVLGEVDMETMRQQATWEPGKSMDELDQEEAELAKLDPPEPPVEFGDFEQATSEREARSESHPDSDAQTLS